MGYSYRYDGLYTVEKVHDVMDFSDRDTYPISPTRPGWKRV
jgi:hypothetical protein